MQMLKSKKGMAGFSGFAVELGILVITVAIIGVVVVSVRDTQTQNSIGWNISNNGASGVTQLSTFFVVIGIVGAAVVVLSLLRGFGGAAGGGSY